MSKEKALHSINGYIHNVANLLKCLQEDAVINNEDTKEMLKIALDREEEILMILEKIQSKEIQ